MDAPKLILGRDIYRIKNTKLGTYRLITKYGDNPTDSIDEMIFRIIDIISIVYGVDEQKILENIETDDILPIYHKIQNYFSYLLGKKMEILPNEEAPTAQTESN